MVACAHLTLISSVDIKQVIMSIITRILIATKYTQLAVAAKNSHPIVSLQDPSFHVTLVKTVMLMTINSNLINHKKCVNLTLQSTKIINHLTLHSKTNKDRPKLITMSTHKMQPINLTQQPFIKDLRCFRNRFKRQRK